jgi:hypothetical protein
VIAGAAAAFYFRFARQWHLNWGATEQEASGAAAGDELMPHPDIMATRAVEIDAPPSAIWPWLVQMGPGRGGAYTYDWIERRLGIDIHNSDRIIPEFQHLQVGDEIPMPGYAMRVERLNPERAMVFRSSNHAWVWSFDLRPADGHTRLISRNRFDTRLALEGQARLPGHRTRLMGNGTQDAPHHQTARRTPRSHIATRMTCKLRASALPGGCGRRAISPRN